MVKENAMQQTEIGLIPEDWEVKKLSEIAVIKRGKFTPRPRNNPIYYGGDIPFVQTGDVTNSNGRIVKYSQTLNQQGLAVSALFTKGTILMTIAANIGYTGVLQIDMACPDSLVAIDGFDQVANNYLNFYFSYRREKLDSLSTSGTQKNLNIELLSPFQVPLPPLPEQQAIAEALIDADAWIESLEDLIAKKRLIKQGAMQELLTPKEGWKEISIIEIAEGKRDLFNDGDWVESEHIKSEGIRLIQTGNIGIGKFLNRENRKYINEKSFLDLKCKELLEGDLLICRLAEPAGRACIFPKTSDRKTITSVDVTIFRPDVKKYDRSLIMYILCTDEWFKNVIEQVGGTTHKRISRGNLGLIKINLPNSLTEQNRIATILTDMDTEIEQLEQKLTKARQIKQGMMQELLTGRVRLV